MARKLKTFETPSKGGGRPPIYPWEKWFDGGLWELTEGRDFSGNLHTMSNLIRATASRRGFACSVFCQKVNGSAKLTIVPRSKKKAS